jgi:hypothetical protein
MSEPAYYVYLAGPLSDPLPTGYLANVRRLNRTSRELILCGYCTFNPATDMAECLVDERPLPLALLQHHSMQHLEGLQYVPHGIVFVVSRVSLGDGHTSAGVAAEIEAAEALGIPVVYNRMDLDIWRIRINAAVAP